MRQAGSRSACTRSDCHIKHTVRAPSPISLTTGALAAFSRRALFAHHPGRSSAALCAVRGGASLSKAVASGARCKVAQNAGFNERAPAHNPSRCALPSCIVSATAGVRRALPGGAAQRDVNPMTPCTLPSRLPTCPPLAAPSRTLCGNWLLALLPTSEHEGTDAMCMTSRLVSHSPSLGRQQRGAGLPAKLRQHRTSLGAAAPLPAAAGA